MTKYVTGMKRNQIIQRWLQGIDDEQYEVFPTKKEGKYIVKNESNHSFIEINHQTTSMICLNQVLSQVVTQMLTQVLSQVITPIMNHHHNMKKHNQHQRVKISELVNAQHNAWCQHQLNVLHQHHHIKLPSTIQPLT